MSEGPRHRNDWWMRHANLTEEQRFLLRRRASGYRVSFAVVLITIGVLLFLGNLGIFPIRDVWVFWPAFPIAAGIGKLMSGGDSRSRVFGILLILFGGFFLLDNLGWIHVRTNDDSWLVALILIGVGLAALTFRGSPYRFQGHTHAPPFSWHHPQRRPDYEHAINDFVLFGALKRKLETLDFHGGELTTIFGNIELDLRHASITPEVRSVVINVMTVFGATKLRVPLNWRVIVSGAGILGNFEDKTIPPNTGPDAPTLIISGFCIFGTVEIED